MVLVASTFFTCKCMGWCSFSHNGTPSDKLLKDTDLPFGCTYLWTLDWTHCQRRTCQGFHEHGDLGGFSSVRGRNGIMSVYNSMPCGCPTADMICLENVFAPLSLSFFDPSFCSGGCCQGIASPPYNKFSVSRVSHSWAMLGCLTICWVWESRFTFFRTREFCLAFLLMPLMAT